MQNLSSISRLVVTQRKEWGEILTGFETVNKYAVSDDSGRMLYWAAEEPGSMLLRWFLKALRPFTIAILARDGDVVLRVERRFRFYFHRAEVVDAYGQSLGVIERPFLTATPHLLGIRPGRPRDLPTVRPDPSSLDVPDQVGRRQAWEDYQEMERPLEGRIHRRRQFWRDLFRRMGRQAEGPVSWCGLPDRFRTF